ncbi:hypothetical protein HanXRQr2_Chr13g0584171 [Helianthus annuus]|uniref:Uncharacterized protein n=1 Tax=Helianthus annuus TaxID=4232 RepID=A0A9K3HAL3_HELAN|nr:hypothetical protein HanXRQr2_Chr13g0584171 [Helianthus annuus]KAJ0848860.1 hypothetical protein HanPSC8_Chr13g0562391 [Helianthus annuus]
MTLLLEHVYMNMNEYWTIIWLVAHPCLQAQHSPTTSLDVALANRTVYTSMEMGVCDIFFN